MASAEQTAVSHSALMKLINFDSEEHHQQDIELAERYLLATALNTHPTDNTLRHLLVRILLCLQTSQWACCKWSRTSGAHHLPLYTTLLCSPAFPSFLYI